MVQTAFQEMDTMGLSQVDIQDNTNQNETRPKSDYLGTGFLKFYFTISNSPRRVESPTTAYTNEQFAQ
jgi:hypothetical protein